MKFYSLFALSLIGSTAFAYIPPISFILSEAAKSHEGIKTIVMEGKITDLKTNATLKEMLHVDFSSGRLHVAYFNDVEPEGAYDSTVKDVHHLGKFWMLGMDPSSARFRQALAELNVLPNNDKVEAKLSRSSGEVTWAWGEDPKVQFVKDDFLPADYITGESSPASQEILISDYTSSASSTRVPKTVVLRFQGKDTYRFEVKNVKINSVLKFQAPADTLKSAMAKDWVTLVR
jgi:hypothetical protein